jgi:hypothetical protein
VLSRLNYNGVPGAADLVLPETGEHDPAKITLSVVPALHFGAVLDRVWVDLVEVGGAVLQRRFVDAGGIAEWESTVASVRELEHIANRLELGYSTQFNERKAPPEFLRGVAEIVAEIWLARATSLFPERRFVTSIVSDSGESPVVCLEQDDGGVPVQFRHGVANGS